MPSVPDTLAVPRPAPLTDAEFSSSDHALLHRAPSCIALRWREASRRSADPSERLKRRLDFLETSLRYIACVIAVEVSARGLSVPKSWEKLVDALESSPPSLGSWAAAARDLSVTLLTEPEVLLESTASVLAQRTEVGRVEVAPASTAVSRLVALRNADVHPDAKGVRRSDDVLAESEADFRTFLAALRSLGVLDVWVATDCPVQKDGSFIARVGAQRGVSLPPETSARSAMAIRTGTPFVVGKDGAILYLAPLLHWGDFGEPERNELRLFSRWRNAPLFTHPARGGDAKAAPTGQDTSAQSWLIDGLAGALVRGVMSAAAAADLQDAERNEPIPVVPGFRVVRPLGHGGTARVYLAQREENEERVALKVLNSTLAGDHGARERLQREHLAMQRIQHPNVARVYEFIDRHDASPCVVMEYVEGTSLRSRVDGAPLRLTLAVEVLEQVLAGLGAAHRLGIVHRDVTPENVILDSGDRAKLLDFGIAVVEGQERFTGTMDGHGKLNFAAPEQIRSPKEAGPPADVFGAGRLLGFLASGSAQPGEQLPSLPGALQAIVRKATSPLPADRYPDADAFAAALREARAEGWAGPPLNQGDTLSPTVRVVRPVRALLPGLWLIEARQELYHEPRWCVVAERTPAAEHALQAALEGFSPEARVKLGHPTILTTLDGVHYCAFQGASEGDVVSALSPATEGTATTPPESGSAGGKSEPWISRNLPAATWATPMALVLTTLFACLFPPLLFILPLVYLRYARSVRLRPMPAGPRPAYLPAKLPLSPEFAWEDAALVLDSLALVVCAQRRARQLAAIDEDTWAKLQSQPLLVTQAVLAIEARQHHASQAVMIPDPRAVTRARDGVTRLARALRGRSVRKASALRRDVSLAAVYLFQLAWAGGADLPATALAPFVWQTSGRWFLMDARRPGQQAPLLWK